MTENIDHSNRSLLNSYIEKLSGVQSSIQELHAEIGQLRKDARTDGFNIEAVNILGQIVAKSSHDGGVGLLRDLVKYAHQIGIELDTVTIETNSNGEDFDTMLKDNNSSASRYRAFSNPFDKRLVLLFQLGLGLGVAWLFIYFLR